MADPDEQSGGEVSDGTSEHEHEDVNMTEGNQSPGAGANGEVKKKYDPKDPLRPRRKKARRACFACQRAHLTCGDERPCSRCIKRGLADACQDGVRKKAKYLHDAPPEALRPVLGPTYAANINRTNGNGNRNTSIAGSENSSMSIDSLFSPTSPNMPFSMSGQANLGSISEGMPFGTQSPAVSPSFQTTTAAQMSGLSMPQVTGDLSGITPGFFDASNPTAYGNLNLDSFNFGSQYGALEFGILNQISNQAAAESVSRDPSISASSGIFNSMINPFDGSSIGDMFPLDTSGNPQYAQGNLQHGLPHAFAIAAAPPSLQSPSTEHDSPTDGFGQLYTASPTQPQQTSEVVDNARSFARPVQQKPKTPRVNPQSLLGKRQRDPSSIYDTVNEPFSYVGGFHRLIATLKRRFPGNKISRIAQALASFRPSFISCTRTLNRADLIFMEKCFQRTLFEYEDLMHHGSSPTIVCRRTGEIAAVNKEFTALTGWTRDVLLGEEPNLNVNRAAGSRSDSNASSLTTPQLKAVPDEAMSRSNGKSQPLFVAELMDDDSVVQFYDDFAHLAFGDARGSVTRKCQLLKYRRPSVSDSTATGSDIYAAQSGLAIDDSQPPSSYKRASASVLSARVARIDGEHGVEKIGKDGKLACSYCWTIRRDTFEMPMMIVMNFLPRYHPNQEPHQLAV